MGWNEPDNKDRDPWDGHGNLDDFLAQLKRRWEARFGGPGSGGFRPPLWWFVVVILVGIWLLSGVYEVGGGNQAVVLRLEHYVGTVGTGLHWRWPWPITETQMVDVKQSRSVTRNGTLATADGQLVSAAVTVKYHIDKPYRYLYASASPTQLLDAWADSVLLDQVHGHSLAELREQDKNQQALSLSDAQESRIADLDPGVKVDAVQLSRLQPPDEVAQASETAESQRKQAAATAESAEKAAEAAIGAARKQADRIIAQAKQQASERLADAQAAVARFEALVPAWQKAPHVTELMLRNEALRDALTSAPKIIVSGSVHAVTLPASALTGQAPAAATRAGAKATRGGGGQSQ